MQLFKPLSEHRKKCRNPKKLILAFYAFLSACDGSVARKSNSPDEVGSAASSTEGYGKYITTGDRLPQDVVAKMDSIIDASFTKLADRFFCFRSEEISELGEMEYEWQAMEVTPADSRNGIVNKYLLVAGSQVHRTLNSQKNGSDWSRWRDVSRGLSVLLKKKNDGHIEVSEHFPFFGDTKALVETQIAAVKLADKAEQDASNSTK